MDITVNGKQLDFDEALSKHNSIKSHSCPPVSGAESHPDVLDLHRKWPQLTTKSLQLRQHPTGAALWDILEEKLEEKKWQEEEIEVDNLF